MLTPAEANLLKAFLKNARPQAVNMEQAVREAINYQRCVDLVDRETQTPAMEAESKIAQRARAKIAELAAGAMDPTEVATEAELAAERRAADNEASR